jgi:CTD kinase subunit gamma
VQPTIHTPLPPRLASFYPLSASLPQSASRASGGEPAVTETVSNEFPIDVEFDNAWETTSDWNADDDEAVQEENALCFLEAVAEPTTKS